MSPATNNMYKVSLGLASMQTLYLLLASCSIFTRLYTKIGTYHMVRSLHILSMYLSTSVKAMTNHAHLKATMPIPSSLNLFTFYSGYLPFLSFNNSKFSATPPVFFNSQRLSPYLRRSIFISSYGLSETTCLLMPGILSFQRNITFQSLVHIILSSFNLCSLPFVILII